VVCESICPEVFKVKHGKFVKGATVIEGVDYSALEDKIWQAVNACPVEVIKYESA
jgi:ferredoxin